MLKSVEVAKAINCTREHKQHALIFQTSISLEKKRKLLGVFLFFQPEGIKLSVRAMRVSPTQ